MDPRSFRWPSDRVRTALYNVMSSNDGRVFVHELLAASGLFDTLEPGEGEFLLGRRSLGQFVYNALQLDGNAVHYRLMQDEARDEQSRLVDEAKKKGTDTNTETQPETE